MMKENINKEIEISSIVRVIASSDIRYYWEIFNDYRSILKDYKIIYVDDNATDYGLYIKDFFKLKSGLFLSCFYSDKLKIMNDKVYKNDRNSKKSKIFTSFDIQLDTNVVSELDNMLRGKNFTKIYENDLKSLTKKRYMHSTISIGPYIMENYYNNANKFTDTMSDVYYNFMLELNKNHDKNLAVAIKKTKDQVKQIREFYQHRYTNLLISQINDNLYKRIYVNLLKIVILYNSNYPIKDKIIKMMKFQDKELCSYFINELNIATKFFEEKFKFSFFTKLQKPKREKVVDIIKNMAWDLFHLRSMELAIANLEYEKADFVFPLLFSFDKKFNELRKEFGMRLIIYDTKTKNYYPFYKEDKYIKYLNLNQIKKLNSNSSKTRRLKKAPKVNLEKMIKKYEKNIIEIYKDN